MDYLKEESGVRYLHPKCSSKTMKLGLRKLINEGKPNSPRVILSNIKKGSANLNILRGNKTQQVKGFPEDCKPCGQDLSIFTQSEHHGYLYMSTHECTPACAHTHTQKHKHIVTHSLYPYPLKDIYPQSRVTKHLIEIT